MAFQYPWGNLQGLNLTWFINQFKKLREDWATAEAGIDGALDAEIQRAEDAMSDVFTARDAAAASATAAGNSASAAALSATAAQNSASAAASSATLANNKAIAAGLSEAAAAQSASQAALSASNAGNAATQAGNSATAAGNSATAAGNSATAAGNSATAAAGSASAAAISETNAAASAQRAEDAAASAQAGAVVKSVENVPIASVNDALDENVVELVVDIEPVQSGTGDPAPDNVRPITGWTRANVYKSSYNLLDQSFITEASGWALSEDEGFITYGELDVPIYKGTIKALYDKYSGNHKLDLTYIKLDPNKDYYITYTWRSVNATPDNGIKIIVYFDNGTSIATGPQSANQTWTRRTVVIPRGKQLSELSFNYNASFPIYLTGFAVVEKNIFDQFDDPVFPSNIVVYPITFPTEAGTVYGGTLTINEDGSGELKVTDANIISYNGEYLPSTWISSMDVYVAGATPTTGAQVVYKLASLITYPLTSQQVITLLAGTNNIWADTGGIDLLRYYADSIEYIDAQDALVKALIAKELDEMKADTALTANDLRIINNTLYRITAPIASGATLTPGTNCEATTVAAILKTLLT